MSPMLHALTHLNAVKAILEQSYRQSEDYDTDLAYEDLLVRIDDLLTDIRHWNMFLEKFQD